jgi:hypothetical protein
MSQQNKYRCAHEHGKIKRGDVITEDQYKTVSNPEYWVPVVSDQELKNMKQAREKMVNSQNIVRK